MPFSMADIPRYSIGIMRGAALDQLPPVGARASPLYRKLIQEREPSNQWRATSSG